MPFSKALSLGVVGSSGIAKGGSSLGLTAYQTKWMGYSPFAFWLMNETEGTTAISQVSSPDMDGAYSGTVTLANSTNPEGVVCPRFTDGGSSRLRLDDNSGFSGSWDGDEITVAAWYKPSSSLYSTNHNNYLMNFWLNGENHIQVFKMWQNTATDVLYRAGNWGYYPITKVTVANAPASTWRLWALTASTTTNNVSLYVYDSTGSQKYKWSTGMNHDFATGDLIDGNIAYSSEYPYDGWISMAAIWNSALSEANVADLATVI